MDGLVLDRMLIEEAGPDPVKIAAAVHDQLGAHDGPVPVVPIARALHIVAIREAALRGCEAALITTADRHSGDIVVKASVNSPRGRFSIAHELGHYLNIRHKLTVGGGFTCTEKDFGSGWARPRFGSRPAAATRAGSELFRHRAPGAGAPVPSVPPRTARPRSRPETVGSDPSQSGGDGTTLSRTAAGSSGHRIQSG